MKNETSVYVLDLDNILKFIFNHDNEENANSEIIETYEPQEELIEGEEGYEIKRNNGDITLSSRTIKETKGLDNNGKIPIKYDLFKTLLTLISQDPIDQNNVTMGQTIALNTMLTYELIKEIK